ncbi:hypothetical protein EDB83DRAFT_2516492 [Lactarius deliciosus]|nr:hypothetical protein EDB83DRAFT_2516492 [Lactarius deliciosus]
MHSTEAWGSYPWSYQPEKLAEHRFGYPLQRMVPIESESIGGDSPPTGEESPFSGLYSPPLLHRICSTCMSVLLTSNPYNAVPIRIHIISDFEAVVDEYLSHYQNLDQNSDAQYMNPAPRLLYTTERADDAVFCLERLFDCDHRPLQTVANVVDYILQPPMPNVAYQGLCFLHEHKIAHCEYGDPNGVMMDIGRSSSAGFDRTSVPVRYYRVNFSRATRKRIHTLVDEAPKIGGKSLVVAMTGGEYGADAQKLFEALCKGIDAAT